MFWRHAKIIEKIVGCMATRENRLGCYRFRQQIININTHGIAEQPGLVLLLGRLVAPAILVLRHAVGPARPELQRSLQLELTSISALQKGHLQLVIQ